MRISCIATEDAVRTTHTHTHRTQLQRLFLDESQYSNLIMFRSFFPVTGRMMMTRKCRVSIVRKPISQHSFSTFCSFESVQVVKMFHYHSNLQLLFKLYQYEDLWKSELTENQQDSSLCRCKFNGRNILTIYKKYLNGITGY